MTPRSRLLAPVLVIALALASVPVVHAGDETCRSITPTWWAPTGVIGCTLDGPTDGRASWYGGDVAAANWCLYPWDDCGWVRVQSHDTGLVITVPVGMICGCYTGDPGRRRLVDLTREQVLALGLDPADGIFGVTVTPIQPPAVSGGSPSPEPAVSPVEIRADGPSGLALPDTSMGSH